jgi:hypothetical protein
MQALHRESPTNKGRCSMTRYGWFRIAPLIATTACIMLGCQESLDGPVISSQASSAAAVDDASGPARDGARPYAQVAQASSNNGKELVSLCHFTHGRRGDARFILIRVSESAVEAHIGHGDQLAIEYFTDLDGDGFGAGPGTLGCEPPAGLVDNADDCDDTSAATFPGAAPEDDPAACMKDADGDGYGDIFKDDYRLAGSLSQPPPGVIPGTDCNDEVATVYPGAPELDDGYDTNCNCGPEFFCYTMVDCQIRETNGWKVCGDGWTECGEGCDAGDDNVDLTCDDVTLAPGESVTYCVTTCAYLCELVADETTGVCELAGCVAPFGFEQGGQ